MLYNHSSIQSLMAQLAKASGTLLENYWYKPLKFSIVETSWMHIQNHRVLLASTGDISSAFRRHLV
jgi:hypothetical protein